MFRTYLNRQSRGCNSGPYSVPPSPEFSAVGNSIDGLLDADSDGAIWSGADGGFGYTYCNLYYPIQTAKIKEMGYYCTQSSNNPLSGVKLGIYEESSKNLIAETALTVCQVGGIFVPLLNPVILERAKAYYIALSCNENGARFLLRSSKWGGAGLPSISFEIPNAMCPSNYGANFSNKRTYRYNIGAF